MKKAKRNGITFSIENWKPIRKKPVLVVSFDGENAHYKVASFNSEETAKWFADICTEFFKEEEKVDKKVIADICGVPEEDVTCEKCCRGDETGSWCYGFGTEANQDRYCPWFDIGKKKRKSDGQAD